MPGPGAGSAFGPPARPLSVHIGSFGPFSAHYRHFARREQLTAPKEGVVGGASRPVLRGVNGALGGILPEIFTPNASRPRQRHK